MRNPPLDDAYSTFVALRFKAFSGPILGKLHAAIGISGEAGELLDTIKKTWVYGKPLDRENIIEELGDLEFYMEALRDQIGVTRTEVIEANVIKLNKRYPVGYSDSDAIARADKEAS